MEKTILIVDNDLFSTRILSKLLGGVYNVVCKPSADEALLEIEQGLKPNVVLSTRVLKGMNGILFLNKISEKFPNCFRILITGEKDPKKILEMVSQSSVNLFLTKPFNSLQLLQLLKIGIAATSNTPISSVVQNVNHDEILKTSIKTLSNMIIEAERYYFRPHTLDMVEICRVASTIFEFNEEQQKNLFYATLLHNHYLLGLPDLFRVSLPDELPDSLKKHFFTHFLKSQKNILQITSLEKYINLACMIFEHVDGTGGPNRLTVLNIPREIQFLILLNIYHNLVYRLNKLELEKLKFEGKIVQSRSDTLKKHQDAITYLYKNIKWFDHDLFYKFQELIKKREILGLKFNEKDLVLEMNENIHVTSFLTKNDKIRYLKEVNFENKVKVMVLNSSGDVQSNYLEEKTSIRKLKEGDITTNPIVDYNNNQIIPAFYEHTESSINSLIERLSTRSISEVCYKKAD